MAKIITNLTDEENQVVTAVSEDGYEFTLHLKYNTNSSSWFYSMEYTREDGSVFSLGKSIADPPRRLTATFNAFFNYRKQLPFGLLVTTTDEGDPYFLTDFIQFPNSNIPPRITLQILGFEEVKIINSIIDGY